MLWVYKRTTLLLFMSLVQRCQFCLCMLE